MCYNRSRIDARHVCLRRDKGVLPRVSRFGLALTLYDIGMISVETSDSEPPRPLRKGKRLGIIQKSPVDDLGKVQGCWEEPPGSPQRKRKRAQEVDRLPDPVRAHESRKRTRVSNMTARVEEDSQAAAESPQNEQGQDPILYWSHHGRWPEDYLEDASNMSSILAGRRSRPSFSRKGSGVGAVGTECNTLSDQEPWEATSDDYRDPGYEGLLSFGGGSFMRESNAGITAKSKREYQTLLDGDAGVPNDSLFRDDIFSLTCQKIQHRNKAKVLQDITRLIVPSAETLATYGATELGCLVESVNKDWNDCIPITIDPPQPDYAVGFRRKAFTEDQRKRLEPFVGDVTNCRNETYFMATYYMYFPFLTCQVEYGAAGLDIADRRNAHSMTLAVRGIVELFRYIGREKEIDREILAFSISHDDRSVRIYGHYAAIDGKKQTYYRHPIRAFDFTDVREKWTAHKFTKNVYNIWMPMHLSRICSAIEQFPSQMDFDVSQSELHFVDSSGLSQEQASRSAQSFAGSQCPYDYSSVAEAQDVTPNTSVDEAGAVERPKRKCGRKPTGTSSP